jgi:23S rRNA pseudouridine2605 synthase
LLILASEGKFALAIARHTHEIPVEDRVRALRPSQDEAWPEMPTAVDVEGQAATFRAVEPAGTSGTNMWFKVTSDRTLPRGAIRALFDSAGLKISRAMLVKWGPIALPRDLPRGRSRALEGEELDSLYALAGRDRSDTGLKPRPRPRPAPDRRRKKTTARRSGGR